MEAMPDLSVPSRHALQEAVLTPRFDAADFQMIDALDIDKNGLRDKFGWIKDEFALDNKKSHFRRNEGFLADMTPQIATPANAWRGLQGFPNYPGPDHMLRVAAAD
ncbi:MAG: hypothetical protein WCJ55_04400 [Chloroflexales bacterium]